MGMTLWIHTLVGRQMSQDSDDHSELCRRLDELDQVCKGLGVTPIFDFVDFTCLQQELADDFDDDESAEPDPETGCLYGIDELKWFDPTAGLTTLQALRDHLVGGPTPEDDALLVEELEDCIAQLRDLPAAGKFHLSMVP